MEEDMAGDSKESKRSKMSHVVKEVDGLSDLPDNIVYHILSFLDTKSAVQTSSLSRRWRCCWKHVPVLYFRPRSFARRSSFRKHVRRVLSRRFHSTPVRNVTLDIYDYNWDDLLSETFEKIMKYAASSGDGDGGGLHNLAIICYDFDLGFRECVADCITAAHHNESLKTMKVAGFNLETGALDLGFRSLTTLELYKCCLENVNPFANLPCLNYLKILDCFVDDKDTDVLMISGLQLLDLEVKIDFFYEYEVIAPKLKSLRLWGDNLDKYLPKLNVPALDHANICLLWKKPEYDASLEEENRAFVDYLLTLRNAESVKLRFEEGFPGFGDQDWAEQNFPLRRIKTLLEPEVPPFTRLKSLTIQCAHLDKPPKIPYQVIRFFLEGSPNTEEKLVQIEMI